MNPLRRAAAAACATALLAGCSELGGVVPTTSQPAPAAVIEASVDDGARELPLDTLIELTVTDGVFTEVEVAYKSEGERQVLPGELDESGSTWTAGDLLLPDTRYALRASAENADGEAVDFERIVRSEDVPDSRRVFPSIAPLDGEEVGVGMPVVVLFDQPVEDRANVERNLHIVTEEQIEGTWGWISDTEVRYRTRDYWPSGTEVTVVADLNGVSFGGGRYGKLDREISFTVGDRVISTVNVKTLRMGVNINGERVKTFRVTTGKPGFESRNGVKVVMEKHEDKTMDSSTTNDTGSDYRVDVKWALRLTYSGEFIHAAPWSTGQQGSANVSHGCVGMTTADARWLYERTRRGDIVKFTGSKRPLERENGWTDWDISYQEFAESSALDDAS